MASPLERVPIVDFARWLLRQSSGRRVKRRTIRRLLREADSINATRRFCWVAQRKDGKRWAGPYKWQGDTFTDSAQHVHRWGSEAACRSAILWSGLVDVQPVKIPASR